MWTPALDRFFIGKIREDCTAEGAVLEPCVKSSEVSRKGSDVVIVVRGVLAQVLASQRTSAPVLVIRVTQQVVLGDTLVQFSPKGI